MRKFVLASILAFSAFALAGCIQQKSSPAPSAEPALMATPSPSSSPTLTDESETQVLESELGSFRLEAETAIIE